MVVVPLTFGAETKFVSSSGNVQFGRKLDALAILKNEYAMPKGKIERVIIVVLLGITLYWPQPVLRTAVKRNWSSFVYLGRKRGCVS